MTHLEGIFKRVRGGNLKLNPKKCCFAKQTVECLDHVVTPDGVQPNPEKACVVREFPVPKNLKELRTFIGLANYYKTEAGSDAFDKLKRALVSAPVLTYSNFKQELLYEMFIYSLLMQAQPELALLLLKSRVIEKWSLLTTVAV